MRISDEVLKQVVFDSGDWGSMRELCKNHEQYPVPLLGKTSIGEDIIIEVLSDRIITEVYQENGWVRKNRSEKTSITLKNVLPKNSSKGSGSRVSSPAKKGLVENDNLK